MNILVIPDIQAAPGKPVKHLEWAWNYIDECSPDVIVQLGDLWDFPSLSSYDEGKYCMADRRVLADYEAGKKAEDALVGPKRPKNTRLVFLEGNHEERVTRHLRANPKLQGLIPCPKEYMRSVGWEVHDFLKPVTIAGVTFCHFFPVTGTGTTTANAQRNGASSAAIQLRALGRSSVAGHKQGFDQAMKIDPVTGRRVRAIIAGSCYTHNESYMPGEFQKYWRGILMLRNVHSGDFDLEEISLDRLRREYG